MEVVGLTVRVYYNISSRECVVIVHKMCVISNLFSTYILYAHAPKTTHTGALSALADRIKIARKGIGDDINLSIQYVLNCGGGVAGSCWGGSHSGAYEFAKTQGFIPYDTCQPYLACSSDSGKCILHDVNNMNVLVCILNNISVLI